MRGPPIASFVYLNLFTTYPGGLLILLPVSVVRKNQGESPIMNFKKLSCFGLVGLIVSLLEGYTREGNIGCVSSKMSFFFR